MSVGHSPSQSQWAADRPKDASQVTAQEVREAKRRIQGSLSAEDSPEDSGGDDLQLPPAASGSQPISSGAARLAT